MSEIQLVPVTTKERIHILDILRGFAIFGILAVNIGGFASPQFYPGYEFPELQASDELAYSLMIFFTEGKFYTIFSFLFGLGFAVQLSRAEAKGKDINSFYPRRLWWLLIIGILHAALLWTGDILRLYALLGFALLAFRKRSNRTVMIWASIFFVLSFLMLVLTGGPSAPEDKNIFGFNLIQMVRDATNSTSYLDLVIFQSKMVLPSFLIIALIQGFSVMALFLVGMLAGRSQFFEQLPTKSHTLKRGFFIGLIIGVVFNWIYLNSEDAVIGAIGFTIGAPALALTYICALSLISISNEKILAPLSAVGRMALTNYILQSVICSILFSGYGFGLYENVDAASLWGIVFAIYILQIPFSMWWLKNFQFGPMEWLWRSLTYKAWQPFYKKQEVLHG